MPKELFWICLFAIQIDCTKINLALNKRAFLSSLYKEHYARYAVDGNVNKEIYAHADSTKNKDGWLVVDLGRPYQVEYVVFYHRSECLGCNDRMNNFIVGLSNNFHPNINKTINRDYKLCAKYNGSLDPGARVEMQCEDKESYSRYVIVQQDIGKEYLAVPEIEVYGEYINYVGCFKTLKNFTNHGSNTNLVQCINTCESFNYLSAAFQISKCLCGNSSKNISPLSECNVKCPGDVDFCGSSDKFSVYEVFPLKFIEGLKSKYIGCFVDVNYNRDLALTMPSIYGMTVAKCKHYCSGHNYLFYGLQFGSQCFCDNHYGKHGIDNDNQCNMTCSGNISEMCGSANLNSIYSVYIEQGGSYFSRSNHHCKDDKDLDFNGACDDKKCKEGWTGDDCRLRNCSIQNGDCGSHSCQTTNVNGETYSECICMDGYDRKYWWDNCQDVDECMEVNLCNSTISNCTNVEGGYECTCLTGLETDGKESCIDIDECNDLKDECNSTTTHCSNTFGSYFCECNKGFKNEGPYSCTDVDECLDGSHSCNSTISNCTNTIGSYECECLHGYHYDSSSNTCTRPTPTGLLKTVFISIVCVSVGLLILLGSVLAWKQRKSLKRFEKIIMNEYSQEVLGAEDHHIQDSMNPEQGGVPMSRLKDYFRDNKNLLSLSFEKIPQIAAGVSTSYGQQSGLKAKNKYKNILPFDKNRVVLQQLPGDSLSDYINASFVPSYDGTSQFIAAQGPIKDTEYDFWRMILENKVEIIVMLTNCIENGKVKCVQYWPDEGSKLIKDIDVSLKESKNWSTHDVRKLIITKDGTSHAVQQMVYKSWFDHKVPENVGSVLNFHHAMRHFERRNRTSPIVVHCSAGVGRTGTFIAIDHLLHEAQRTQEVDVLKCVQFLRSQRNHMIQTKNQFMFCFDALILYNELGSTTAIKVEDGLKVQQMLSERKHLISKEYERISELGASEDVSMLSIKKAKQYYTPGCAQNSTYKISILGEISWLDVVKTCKGDKKTPVVLIDERIDQRMKTLPYSGQDGSLYACEKSSKTLVSHIECVFGNPDDHIYTNAESVNIFAVSAPTFEELKHLWAAVRQFRGKERLTLICSDNISKAGFVACALNLLEMKEELGEIDVYQVVYQMKGVAPQIIESHDIYQRLYLFVESGYSDEVQVYVNSDLI